MSRLPGKAAKPAALEKYVTLVVTDDEGRRLVRTMRSTDKLNVLMNFYYDLVPSAASGDGVFLRCRNLTRKRIRGSETPADHGMKDGEVILFQLLPDITPDMLVTVVLQDFGGRSFTSTMRKTDRMQVLMDFHHGTVSNDGHGGGVFLYRGKCITGEQTPAGLKMTDWDRIYLVPRRRGEVVEDKSDVYITLKVMDNKERTFYGTMRRSDELSALMHFYYATMLGLGAEGNGAFLFDDRELRGWHTPADLEMEDGDQIDYLPSPV